MGREKFGGYFFVTYITDHPPYHVHIEKDNKDIGCWDIVNQRPMGNIKISNKIKKGLIYFGYMWEVDNEGDRKRNK